MKKQQTILLILLILSICINLVQLCVYQYSKTPILMSTGTYVETDNPSFVSRQILAIAREKEGDRPFYYYTEYPKTLEKGQYQAVTSETWMLYEEDGTPWACVTIKEKDRIQIVWPDGHWQELQKDTDMAMLPGD